MDFSSPSSTRAFLRGAITHVNDTALMKFMYLYQQQILPSIYPVSHSFPPPYVPKTTHTNLPGLCSQ